MGAAFHFGASPEKRNTGRKSVCKICKIYCTVFVPEMFHGFNSSERRTKRDIAVLSGKHWCLQKDSGAQWA